jgi:hypothetical protein
VPVSVPVPVPVPLSVGEPGVKVPVSLPVPLGEVLPGTSAGVGEVEPGTAGPVESVSARAGSERPVSMAPNSRAESGFLFMGITSKMECITQKTTVLPAPMFESLDQRSSGEAAATGRKPAKIRRV